MRVLRRWYPLVALTGALSGICHGGMAQIDGSELRARRQRAATEVADGLLLIHSSGGMKPWEASGYHQDPSFYYFTGLQNLQNGILVIDGVSRESWLFVPPPPRRRPASQPFAGTGATWLAAGDSTARRLALDHVALWDDFGRVVDSLSSRTPTAFFYVDGGGQTGGMLGGASDPQGIAPVSNPYRTWRYALSQRWPQAQLMDAWALIDSVRSVKSESELASMRRAAAITVGALRAAAPEIRPGITQRAVEGKAIQAALAAGSDGPSLWPWIRSGEYSLNATFFEAFYDTRNLDRIMRAGDLVRVDLGFDYAGYKGDLGRTFPASGRFTPAQSEALDLLNGAYQHGIAAMRVGASTADVLAAFKKYVTERHDAPKTSGGRAAVVALIGMTDLPIHGLGLDMAEGIQPVFRAGNIVCFEPFVVVDGQQLFVEDEILITADGPRILNPPVAYAPRDLERLMRTRR